MFGLKKRGETVEKMERTLFEYEIDGIITNTPFDLKVLNNDF
ncbi:MAG: hypothetical protein ACOCQ2_02195 [Halanaerobiales bacterium]